MSEIEYESVCRADLRETWRVEKPDGWDALSAEQRSDFLDEAMQEGSAEFVSERPENEEDRDIDLGSVEEIPDKPDDGSMAAKLTDTDAMDHLELVAVRDASSAADVAEAVYSALAETGREHPS